MNKRGNVCYNCGNKIEGEIYFSFNKDGAVDALCKECYNELRRFFVKEGNTYAGKEYTGTTDKGDK